MPRHVFIPLALCLLAFLCQTDAKDESVTDAHKSTLTPTNATCSHNDTNCETSVFQLIDLAKNRAMLVRTFYVLLSVTAVVVLYFVVKSVMLRRKNNKTRKYGVVSTAASELEMQPLDQGDDDDDMTLYEARLTKLK